MFFPFEIRDVFFTSCNFTQPPWVEAKTLGPKSQVWFGSEKFVGSPRIIEDLFKQKPWKLTYLA